MNVKMGFSNVRTSIASCFNHVLAGHVLVDFQESARSKSVLETDLDIGIALDQFVVEIPTDI